MKAKDTRTAEQVLLDNGYEDVVIFKNESYDTALIGVTSDNRAVYSYKKMVSWYRRKYHCSEEDAIDWIDYNTLGALANGGVNGPIVMYDL